MVDQPHDAFGSYPSRGYGFVPPDPRERLGLSRACHGEDDKPRAGDRWKRERDPRMRVIDIARGHHELAFLIESG